MPEELEQRVAKLERALVDQQMKALGLMTSMLKSFLETHEEASSRSIRFSGLEDRIDALERLHPGSVVGTLRGPPSLG